MKIEFKDKKYTKREEPYIKRRIEINIEFRHELKDKVNNLFYKKKQRIYQLDRKRKEPFSYQNKEYCSFWLKRKGKKIKILEEIGGGLGRDNDLSYFGDYNFTIIKMKEILKENGCKPPFIIISDKRTKIMSQYFNHFKHIALEYDPDFDTKDLEELKKKGIKEVVVSEYDYIMSRTWISEWVTADFGYDHRLLLTDGKRGVITGYLSLGW